MTIGLFIVRRLAALIALLLLVSLLVFSLLWLSPGSTLATLIGTRPATPQTIAAHHCGVPPAPGVCRAVPALARRGDPPRLRTLDSVRRLGHRRHRRARAGHPRAGGLHARADGAGGCARGPAGRDSSRQCDRPQRVGPARGRLRSPRVRRRDHPALRVRSRARLVPGLRSRQRLGGAHLPPDASGGRVLDLSRRRSSGVRPEPRRST